MIHNEIIFVEVMHCECFIELYIFKIFAQIILLIIRNFLVCQ
jgi:hypothetical protein